MHRALCWESGAVTGAVRALLLDFQALFLRRAPAVRMLGWSGGFPGGCGPCFSMKGLS